MQFCARDEIRSHPNYAYIKKVVNKIYTITMKTLLLQKVSKAAQKEIIDYETEMKILSEDIYNEAAKAEGKIGILIRWLRKTNYHGYWLLKFIPGSFKR